ncbi:MAG: MDR family MFS transporter [Armatimonadota bacterium]|nr:MDR family MFS transporter [Armatimonadota bacterium]MDR7486994.1 MDR family MFS transporter [Armatimonadota bacterium]MDR7531735.1 MDR family MFS transporter [Armatimonadota bacterium]MDR7534921.1 MDR family MFS transporter [Armatimonadota bacterium]
MTRSERFVTLGIMLGIFMASMESTVVATAMPTIASQIGGLASYSWVFSAYMLAATATVPLFGKLADLYGRRKVFAVAMGLFLTASLLCGLARSMPQLIAFRALQGLGAGGLLPLAFIIIGDLFTVERRARIQGLFSGVWGLSSIVGPLLGGFLVDQVSWPWVFYVNVAPGALAAGLIWRFFEDDLTPLHARPAVDYAGAVLLTAGIVVLLLGLFELDSGRGAPLLATAALLLAALAWAERRAADPVLPLQLFRLRLFAVACAQGLWSGWSVFGSLAFVPLFVQAVLRTSATAAGSTLTPMMLGWVSASILSTRFLLLRLGYRALVVAGMVALSAGTLLMTRVGPEATHGYVMVSVTLMGIGMGLSVPSFMIAVQSAVSRRVLGAATSTLQFARSIGGAFGVSVMGAVLAARLAAALRASGVDPQTVSVNRLLDPLARAPAPALDGTLRTALAGAIQGVFVAAFLAALAALAVTLLAPRGRLALAAPAQDAEALRPEPAGAVPTSGAK